MSLPKPELHTFYDEEEGVRLYYSCEQMAFDIDGDACLVPPLFLSDGLSIPRLFRSIFSKSPSLQTHEGIRCGILHTQGYLPCRETGGAKELESEAPAICTHKSS
jgi:hypothetical protein